MDPTLLAKPSQPQLWKLLLVSLILITSGGTFGYMLIEGWGWFDSLYMTVITVATVGFGEVHPLSAGGRALTILLIFMGAGIFVFGTSAVAEVLLKREILNYFTERRMEQTLKNLSGHVIVCGYGRMSQATVLDLIKNKTPVVVIDKDPLKVQQARKDGCLAVLGDASNEETLKHANVKSAKCLVSLIPKDAENLYVTMAAKELSPAIYIVCRAEEESAEKRLLKAGVSKIVSPYRVGGHKIAKSVLQPYVADFLELVLSDKYDELEIEQVKIPTNSPLCNQSLVEAQINKNSNVIILNLVKPDGTAIFNPGPQERFCPDMTLVVVGSKSELEKFGKQLTGI